MRALVACVALATCASVMSAQVPANEAWLTIRTQHFNVHFTRALEEEARHAATVAERAYANLATELVRPRGTIDIVISDATDVSNGSATVFPSNRIIIYARPPVDEPSLESYDDWTVLVLQHELTHIFHLDRSRGIWSAAQHVFGRNPVLFPNYYTPAWLTEGLAVYYESRFTSGGRLLGSYHSAVARAAAVDHLVPTLDQLSLATSRFPFGESVYVYGSFVWDDLARRHGAERVPEFVERASGATIPFLLNREAKQTFGETFTHAWEHWRDSALTLVSDSSRRTRASNASVVLDSAQAHEIAGGGRQIVFPRWRGGSTVVYVGNNGRESEGLYAASVRRGGGGGGAASGAPERIARRNSLDVNAPGPDGAVVFSQAQYLDRFHTSGDLYIERGGTAERITFGARLSAPDVRPDGEIVAVQTVPAATRLARVSAPDTRGARITRITPMTSVSVDTQWAAPRWSPEGARVAAVRTFAGTSEVVTLDAAGGTVRVLARANAVLRSPAWSPSGTSVLFTSDETGSSQLYAVSATSGTARRLTADVGGVYGVDVVPIGSGGDSTRVVATVLRGDGYHLMVWTVARYEVEGAVASLDSSRALAGKPSALKADAAWLVGRDSSRATRYSPWRTLVPTYWSPTVAQETQGRGALIGALTSGHDVIGRHSYYVEGDVNTSNGNVDAGAQYSYERFIEPVITTLLQQSWSYSTITRGGKPAGDLEQQSRLFQLHATFVRPRARTYSAVTVGAELEERVYGTNPGDLQPHLDPFYSAAHRYPAAVVAAVFSNVQRPTLSISAEDGVVLSGSVRQRWAGTAQAGGRTAVAVARGYKSLNLPGFAHHVIALRAAAGVADSRSPSEYTVGGISGSSLEVVPGISIGSAGRTFPTRGFLAGSETGIRAVSVSGEYRLPLAIPSRGLGLFPLFLDKASAAFFADAARASCPSGSTPVCSPSTADGPTLASVGAELDLDSALQFDVPYRFRVGVAHPVRGAAYAGALNLSAFLTVGGSF
ncbi:MAG: TolB family protein [Gemmatimonadaceae bacterium]